uniref:Col_cuticle_N domain-containing protein n=1 Tax=Steinernema glaseri TaxID=37863 RepID=A0A1I8AQ78_9BILA
MSSGIKGVAFLASAGSGVAIVVSLVVIGNLFMEVNDMYRETLADMDEFKTISNDAWKGMMAHGRLNFDSIFRQKR